MDQQPVALPSPPTSPSSPSPEPVHRQHDFFDVYTVAIDDLHRTRDLAQKIDSLYVTILTLLFTGDAYEIATTKFDRWVPVVATTGVALIGLAVNSRWRRGTNNLFKIVTNRYAWLRAAEAHPDLQRINANIFTQEYFTVYVPQVNVKKQRGKQVQSKASAATMEDHSQDHLQNQIEAEAGFSLFHHRTVYLQSLCTWVFIAIPLLLAIGTFLTFNAPVLQSFARIISGR